MSLVPASNDHRGGLEIDDVGEEADEHLRGGLAADAAVDVGFIGERLGEFPAVGDGVAEEDDATGFGCQLRVGGVVTAELVPVLELIGEGLGGELQAAGGARRGVFVNELGVEREGGEDEEG
jgi:hypothetical protein